MEILRIRDLIIGETEKLTLEIRIYNLLCFIAAAISIVSLFSDIIIDAHLFVISVTTLSALVFLYLYYKIRFKCKFHKWLAISMVMLLLSISWFANFGSKGPILFIYILASAGFIVVSNRNEYRIVISLIFANVLILYYLESFYPSLILPYPSELSNKMDNIITFIYTTLFICFLIIETKKEYIQEKFKVEKYKKLKKEKQESEERYRQIFNMAPTGIYEVDFRTGKFVSLNDTVCEYTGYTRDELFSMSTFDLLSEESQRKFLKRLDQINKGEPVPKSIEYSVLKKDGSEFIAIFNTRFIYEGQNIVGATVVLQDISERKQAEDALKESEKKFRELAALLPETVFEIDATGALLFVNSTAIKHFQYTEYDFEQGLNALDMFIPEDRQGVMETALKVLQGEQLGLNEYTALRKDGSTFPVMLHYARIIHKGKPVGLRGVVIDITERKNLESQLHQSQKMEAIGTLAGGIAHDFNNVLYGMMGYTDLAKDLVPEGSKAQKHLQQVLKGADRAKEMVQQILSFSRQGKKEKNPIIIQSVLKEAVKLLRTSLPSTIEIHQNIDPDCGLVMADPTQIHQIIMNLATNAYHAMRETGGVLDITLMQEEISTNGPKFDMDLHPGSYIKLMVEDTGHGIDGLVMDKIFDPYFTTKGVGEGTGMGLAVVYGIVKEHDGDISVQSEPGKGTAFHVYLPLIETAAFEREIISEKEQVPTGTERILFVDDEEIIVHLAGEILEPLGYHVTSRTSSVEALEVFRSKQDEFDLVITDMTMPNMTGAELASRLLKIRPDIPIILCTGFSELIDANRAKAIGIRQYVMKPILKKELAVAIRKALEKTNAD